MNPGGKKKKRPAKKGSWCLMGLKFKKGRNLPYKHSHQKQWNTEPGSNFCTRACHTACTSQRSLCCTACLHCASPTWARSFWNLISTNRTEVSPSDWSCAALANQSSSVLIVHFEPFKLWGYGVLVCMRTDPSGTSTRDSYPYKPAPLWLGEHPFPFH